MSQMSQMSRKTKAGGTFLEMEGYGQIEVEPGHENFVQGVLKQYMSVDSGVKVTRAPNYQGRYASMSGFSSSSNSSSSGGTKRTCT